MSCGRCGNNKNSRPAQPPTSVGRPGTMAPSTNGRGSSPRDTITGLRYVPSSNK